MKRNMICLHVVLLCQLLFIAPAFAHHSFAQFDNVKSVTLSGTIKEFQWTNPHAWIEVDVVNAKGQPEQWSIETEALAILKGRGWTRNMLKPGDKVSFTTHPKRDGSPGGSLVSITLADGKVMSMPLPPAAAAAIAAEKAAASADKK